MDNLFIQYKDSKNLNKRISIHDKYSTNKQGFSNWIFSNYKIEKNAKVLELGCGTGNMWLERNEEIDTASKIVLSDLSLGMLEEAKKNLFMYPKIEFENINIEDIKYPDESFDIVIANMMLYHVKNIKKALKEVKRVLKKSGVFYCATYGENGIVKYLASILKPCGMVDNSNKNFTLQNGKLLLNEEFDDVIKLEYEDSLKVNNVDDIIDYLFSLSSIANLNLKSREDIKKELVKNMKDGVLNIPKEYGMFISKK